MHDVLGGSVGTTEGAIAIDFAGGVRIHDGTRDDGRDLLSIGQVGHDREGKGFEPIGMRRPEVMPDRDGFDRVREPAGVTFVWPNPLLLFPWIFAAPWQT